MVVTNSFFDTHSQIGRLLSNITLAYTGKQKGLEYSHERSGSLCSNLKTNYWNFSCLLYAHLCVSACSVSYGANFNLSCRANKAAYWQWFKNGVAFKQLTGSKIVRSVVSIHNITSSASFCCMSFLADPFCDVTTDIPVHVKGGAGAGEAPRRSANEMSFL